MQVKKLIGKKIYLGPVSKEEIPILVKWMNDLEVVKYTDQISKNHTEETTNKFLENMLLDRKAAYFGIHTNKGELIGGTDLRDIESTNRSAVLGIVIGEKEHWGKGYGTEAIELLLDYAFNILNLKSVMLTVFEFNKRAIACYEKVGFKMIGKRRKARYLGGKYFDEIYMDILSDEFKKSTLNKLAK
jgi:RimJ/RimL family protein N-acetyltransferase